MAGPGLGGGCKVGVAAIVGTTVGEDPFPDVGVGVGVGGTGVDGEVGVGPLGVLVGFDVGSGVAGGGFGVDVGGDEVGGDGCAVGVGHGSTLHVSFLQ